MKKKRRSLEAISVLVWRIPQEACGDTDQDGDYDDLVCFGARSASIWRIVPATNEAQARLELT